MKRIFASIVIILSFCLTAGANYNYKVYDVRGELPGNCVRSIVQDSVGYIWLATQNGLSMYNGTRFSRIGDMTGINIMKLCLHSDNRHIWVASVNNLYLFDIASESFNEFNKTATNDGAAITRVFSMVYDTDGRLWIGTVNGVFVYDETADTLTHYMHQANNQHSLPDDHVWVIYRDTSDTLWMGTRHGLARYNRHTDSFTCYITDGQAFGKPACNEIISIIETDGGVLWVGTWYGGIGRLDKEAGTITYKFGEGDSLTIPRVRTIFKRSGESLFLGSDDGLYIFYPGTGKCRQADTRHKHESVYECFQDREGGIWIGTYFSGVSYLPPNHSNFEWYHPDSDLPNAMQGKVISQFCEDPSGRIWIATEDRGLNLFDPTTKSFIPLPDPGICYYNLHALMFFDNKLWVGSFSRGLFIYDPATGRVKNYRHSHTDPASLPNDHVYTIYRSQNGTIYIGTLNGCCTFDPVSQRFEPISMLSADHIYDMTEDSDGNLWAASKTGGVWRRDRVSGLWRNYVHNSADSTSLCGNSVLRAYVDPTGNLWFGTEGNGLCRYRPETDSFENYRLTGPHADNTIYGILADRSGNCWLSTNRGLARFNPDTHDTQVYTFDDGLQSNQFNFRSSMEASDGHFYFGGVNGFNRFDPYNLTLNSVKPTAAISAVIMHTPDNAINRSKRVSAHSGKVTIPHQVASFDIMYESLSYVDPNKNRYAYRMDGVMKDWVYTDKNTVSFLNLAPGHYTFRVKSSNNDGLWSSNESTLAIDVLPSVWGTIWMKCIYIFLCIALMGCVWLLLKRRQRIRRKQRYNDEQQARRQELYQAKFTFFTQIAHEIKTPLTLIQAPLESVMDARTWNADVESNLRVIQKNTNRLLLLVKQLLDFRKIESDGYSVMFRQTDLNRLIEDAVERFRTIPMHGITLNVNMPEQHINCKVDREALTKVISNLLVNAMKFARTHISIDMTVNEIPGTQKTISIAVRDDGPGISAAEAEKVFEPFYQTQSDNGTSTGVGIGLSLVRLLVDKHSGHVFVNTDYTDGCEIRIEIPYIEELSADDPAADDSAAEHDDESQDADGQSTSYSVLVVEDNPEMRRFIAKSLSPYYTVNTVENGRKALEFLNEGSADLIISDILMPEMDGFELLRSIRTDNMLCHIPFILLSAIDSIDSKIEGLDYGADAYIEKPFSVNHIRATINNLRENRMRLFKQFQSMPTLACDAPVTGTADTKWLNKLHDIITANLTNEDFTIDRLAQEMTLSRSCLQRKLKGITGMTPNDYIRLIRLKVAGEMLRKGEYRINEVCYIVGFNNPSYFARCFQKQFGILPKDYMRQG